MNDLTNDYVMSIDIGSSSVKGGLFTLSCTLREETFINIQHSQINTKDGGVTEDPINIKNIVENVIDHILSKVDQKYTNIIAVSFDSMASTIAGVDNNYIPVTPFYTYADTRNFRDVEIIKQSIDIDEYHQRTGTMQHTSYIPGRINWLRRTDLERYNLIHKWVDIPTYLYINWFQPEIVNTSYCLASWSGLLNRIDHKWDNKFLELIDLDVDKLPNLSAWDNPITSLNKTFSKRWKLLRNVPFYLGVGDGLSANIGSGCFDSSSLAITIGSTGAMRTILPTNNEIPSGLWSYCFGLEKSIFGGSFTEGGNVIKWANDYLNLDTTQGIDKILLEKKPDTHGLTILPFFSGERSIGWNGSATASIDGLRISTTSEDILQALCESIAHRFSDVYDLLLPYLDDNFEIIASGGSISESKWFTQTMANALNKPIAICKQDQQTLYGTAKLALKGIGAIQEFSEIPVEKSIIIYPNSVHSEIMAKARTRQKEYYTSLFR